MNKYEGHTSGPWIWVNRTGAFRDEGFQTDLAGGDKMSLMYVGISQHIIIHNVIDARLIADAPKLLGQRDFLLQALNQIIQCTDDEDAAEDARRAITECEGME